MAKVPAAFLAKYRARNAPAPKSKTPRSPAPRNPVKKKHGFFRTALGAIAHEVLKDSGHIGKHIVKKIHEAHDPKKNPFTHRGKPAWSGAFDPEDGHVIETHPYEKAERADFHHSHYFSDKAKNAMREGRAHFFHLTGGKVNTEWRERESSPHIVKKIHDQLKRNEPINEDGGGVPVNVASSGAIAGLGSYKDGSQGEPGVKKKKKAPMLTYKTFKRSRSVQQ